MKGAGTARQERLGVVQSLRPDRTGRPREGRRAVFAQREPDASGEEYLEQAQRHGVAPAYEQREPVETQCREWHAIRRPEASAKSGLDGAAGGKAQVVQVADIGGVR